MSTTTRHSGYRCKVPSWHAHFLTLLPAIEQHARIVFWRLDPDSKEEAVAEAIAAATVSYVGLLTRGLGHQAYPSTMARFAVNHVRSGRHVGGHENAVDVLSKSARRRKGFSVRSLTRYDRHAGEWREAVVEDSQTPVLEQVWFRIDFPEWLSRLSTRDRRIAESLALGERTSTVARRHGLTNGRVSQLRRELHANWLAFHGELPPTQCSAAA